VSDEPNQKEPFFETREPINEFPTLTTIRASKHNELSAPVNRTQLFACTSFT
jgi:hypothetical protein